MAIALPPPPASPSGQPTGSIGYAYALIIFLCAIIPGALPIFMQTRFQSHAVDKCIVLGTIFGGGVFIAAGFVHLLGDATKDLNEDDGYPLAQLWCAIGVLLPLCIDQMASLFAERASQAQRRMSGQEASAITQPLSVRANADSLIQSIVLLDSGDRPRVTVMEDSAPPSSAAAAVTAAAAVQSTTAPSWSSKVEPYNCHGHEHEDNRHVHGHGHDESHDRGHGDCCGHGHDESHGDLRELMVHGHGHQGSHEHGPQSSHEHGPQGPHEHGPHGSNEHGHSESYDCFEHGHGGPASHGHEEHAHAHAHAHAPMVVRSRSVTVSIVGTLALFLALTFHSFLAGLVLGFGGGLGAGLFVAIIAHKSFAAWALGCALARTDRKQLSFRAAVISLVGFALTTPSGVMIGMAVASGDALDGRVQPTLVALAAGFFLYVGLMEVVGKELVGYRTKGSGAFALLKLLMLVLGFVLMALLALWV